MCSPLRRNASSLEPAGVLETVCGRTPTGTARKDEEPHREGNGEETMALRPSGTSLRPPCAPPALAVGAAEGWNPRRNPYRVLKNAAPVPAPSSCELAFLHAIRKRSSIVLRTSGSTHGRPPAFDRHPGRDQTDTPLFTSPPLGTTMMPLRMQ